MSERYDHHRTCQHLIYRLSCDDMDALYEHAKGCCQICDTPEAETVRGKLVIDHDPRFDAIAVRGLLCDKCNNLMGKYDSKTIHSSTPRERIDRCRRYERRAWFIRTLTAHWKQRLASRRTA